MTAQDDLISRLERLIGVLEDRMQPEVKTTFEQSMARYNEQASTAAANTLMNAANQQQAYAAQLMKLTADLTKND